MTIIGTSHFFDRPAAVRYYAPYGADAVEVDRKIADGEIHIGPPSLRPGQYAILIPEEGRWQITEANL